MKNRNKVSEKRIVDVLIRYIRRSHVVARELSVYERRIDVAALCPSTGELWSIEAKIADWPKAISQAIVNLAASDRSYIAIHNKNVHIVDRKQLERYGIGLISVGSRWEEVEIICDARLSDFMNRLVVGRLKQRLKI